MTDAQLAQAAADGDAEAFGALAARHRPAALRAAVAALGSHADAEDVVQEALLTAFRQLRSFRGDASFKTWLLTIVWRAALNRRRWRLKPWRRHADNGSDPVSPMPSPETAAAGAEVRRAIAGEIRALAPKLRDALLLASAGEYGYDEIAAMLAIPVGTLKWRVSEARRLVKKRLEGRGHVV